MTFWQENYGFVKEVYDFRLAKYQEWMDNLEAIVSKVMAPNVQYTYKEFKIIQDSLSVSGRVRQLMMLQACHSCILVTVSYNDTCHINVLLYLVIQMTTLHAWCNPSVYL